VFLRTVQTIRNGSATADVSRTNDAAVAKGTVRRHAAGLRSYGAFDNGVVKVTGAQPKVRRHLGHASGPARRTEAALLAAGRDELVCVAPAVMSLHGLKPCAAPPIVLMRRADVCPQARGLERVVCGSIR
jgi:hypothetical protein